MHIQILVETDGLGALVQPFNFCGRAIQNTGLHTLIIDGVEYCVWVVPDRYKDDFKTLDAKWIASNNNLKEQLKESEDKYKQLQESYVPFDPIEAKWLASNNNLLVAHNELEGVNNDLKEQLEESEAKYKQLQEIMTADRNLVADLQNQLKESEAKYKQLQKTMIADDDAKEKTYRRLQEVCAESKKRLRTQHRLQLIEVLELTVVILETE